MQSDGVWQLNSDAALKTNVVALHGTLDKVMRLRPVSFDWISNGMPGIGFVAQEVEPVLPELVSEHSPEDGKTVKGLPYATFSVIAIAAIRDLKNECDLRFRALSDGDHSNHRRDSDNHTECGQKGTHFIAQQSRNRRT